MESTRNKSVFFEVRILDSHKNRVKTIKRIRDIFQVGLKEAKENVDHAPNVVYVLEKAEALPFVQEMTEMGTPFEMRRARRKHKMILHSQTQSTRKKSVFYGVRILDARMNKVKTIKRIRDIFQLGLIEAVKNINQAPNVVYVLENAEALPFVQELTVIGTTFEMTRARRKHKMILHSS